MEPLADSDATVPAESFVPLTSTIGALADLTLGAFPVAVGVETGARTTGNGTVGGGVGAGVATERVV